MRQAKLKALAGDQGEESEDDHKESSSGEEESDLSDEDK
jgi:hypothetical protein